MFFLFIIIGITPPIDVKAFDTPNDAGCNINLTWTLSKDDAALDGYAIYRKTPPDTIYERIGSTSHGVAAFGDDQVQDGKEYVYCIASLKNGVESTSASSNIVKSYEQVFHSGRVNVLISILVFTLFLVFFVRHAKKGKELFIRKIPGLAAVEEAVGRATEMGRPILYVPGLGDVEWTATIASLNILGEVAKKIALYDTPLIAVNRWSVTYSIAKEVVKEAFTMQGRPEKFREDYVRYLTEDQFGFAAAIDGIILREKPATNFFIGRFWAESLIIAEIGAQAGALQIAGTDAVNQLPFFVTACDYTLIGEELYAASAYLSREPLLLGSLKAQDYSKLVAFFILIAFTLSTFIFKLDLRQLLRVQ